MTRQKKLLFLVCEHLSIFLWLAPSSVHLWLLSVTKVGGGFTWSECVTVEMIEVSFSPHAQTPRWVFLRLRHFYRRPLRRCAFFPVFLFHAGKSTRSCCRNETPKSQHNSQKQRRNRQCTVLCKGCHIYQRFLSVLSPSYSEYYRFAWGFSKVPVSSQW